MQFDVVSAHMPVNGAADILGEQAARTEQNTFWLRFSAAGIHQLHRVILSPLGTRPAIVVMVQPVGQIAPVVWYRSAGVIDIGLCQRWMLRQRDSLIRNRTERIFDNHHFGLGMAQNETDFRRIEHEIDRCKQRPCVNDAEPRDHK